MEAVQQHYAGPEDLEAQSPYQQVHVGPLVRAAHKDASEHFEGGDFSAGFREDDRQRFHHNCYYWLVLEARGII